MGACYLPETRKGNKNISRDYFVHYSRTLDDLTAPKRSTHGVSVVQGS